MNLMDDLKATYPRLHVRPVEEKDGLQFGGVYWISGEAEMPDGYPVFSTLHCGEPEYNGTVHAAFEQWLADRGFYLECWDYGLHVVCPLVAVEPEAAL